MFNGESFPAKEKLLTLYESHMDISVKASRDIQYGHTLNLTMGTGGLILDAMLESGKLCNTECLFPMVQRQKALHGQGPNALQQMA